MVFHRRLLARLRQANRLRRARAAKTRRLIRTRSVQRRILGGLGVGLLTVLPIPGSRFAAAGLAARLGFGFLGRGAIRRGISRFAPQLGRFARTAARGGARAAGRAARGVGRGALRFTGLTPFNPLRLTGSIIGAGIVSASPRFRRSIREVPERLFGVGTSIGDKIEGREDPQSPAGLGGTPLGLILGALGLGAAGGLVAPKVIGAIKDKFGSQPFGILPAPSGISSISQPLGAVQPKEQPKEPEPPTMQPLSLPSIKITNKPEINIRFSKSKKFINQQVLIKQ